MGARLITSPVACLKQAIVSRFGSVLQSALLSLRVISLRPESRVCESSHLTAALVAMRVRWCDLTLVSSSSFSNTQSEGCV